MFIFLCADSLLTPPPTSPKNISFQNQNSDSPGVASIINHLARLYKQQVGFTESEKILLVITSSMCHEPLNDDDYFFVKYDSHNCQKQLLL